MPGFATPNADFFKQQAEEEVRRKEEEARRAREAQEERDRKNTYVTPAAPGSYTKDQILQPKPSAGVEVQKAPGTPSPGDFIKPNEAVVNLQAAGITNNAPPSYTVTDPNASSKELTDLRDQFLNERSGVGQYQHKPVAGNPANVVNLDRSNINTDRGLSLSNIGTLRDVSEGRGLATTPEEIQEARGMSLSHIRNLQDIASGKVPGVSDAQRQAAMAEASQTALGLAATTAAAGGGAGALRAGLRSISESGRRVGLDAGMLAAKERADALGMVGGQVEGLRSADQAFGLARAGEQIGARSQIGSQINDLRGADQGLEISETGRLQGVAVGDADRALKGDSIDSQMGLDAYKTMVDEKAGLGKLGLEAQTTSSTTRLNEAKIKDMQEQLKFLYEKLRTETNVEERKQTFALIGSILGSLGTVGAAAAGASDIRVKDEIVPLTREDLREFANAVIDSLSTFVYRPGYGLPEGERVGVMAQSLEKTRLGKAFVSEVDGIKRVDYNGVSVLMSAAALSL